ncbi:long-chain fatty acid transport protein 1 [Bicyclus anynana]|uniref:Very long-chain fatty acid transport protein n=1 Tax=Bicyclus anynana TaxID=110368 RepID=A0A6J1P5B9_BICAN|nr:long-chain fatty acid transport protein 1 [Bicyclus anynana]XP_023952993.1 long-chain fatty acid transport protein 1 [Bicyclus anynana]
MSNIETNNNMNKTDDNNHKPIHQIRDVERGKGASSSTIPWLTILVMVFALAALAAAVAVTWVFWTWQAGVVVLAILLVLYVLAYFWHFLWIAVQTAPRDLKALYCYIKILRLSKTYTKKNWSMPDIFHEAVKKHPKKICFLFEEEKWTFQQVEEYSLRVSAVLKAYGVKRGDTVAVMASNYPEMPAIWLGVTRIGGIAPLINTNQTGNTLLHSINIAHCDYVIYGNEFESAFQDIKKDLSGSIKLLKFTRRPLNVSNDSVKVVESSNDLTHLLETTPPAPWSLSEGEGFLGRLVYIYTSGTTGLPKAAVISPSRMVFMASGVQFLGGLRPSDVIYCPMPLYHSAGGVITMGNAFIFGCTVVLKLKFSASAYFPDCIKYNATAAHYIGEMCRYVLATPKSPTDRQHKVRVVYGNGMRPTIWNEFVKRFGIKRVSEFYGATEGNANIVNIDSKPGAIGFISRIIPAVYPIAIIKVDEDTGEPIRDKRGLCQIAGVNEPGVFIGKIKPNNPSRAFLGYVDKEASDKKIVRDVLSHGDSAFISGDVLVADELGYLYFRDRTGDTFRWRGENVSTTEVEAAISRVADQRDAVVYGVEIPDIEGRAGMCGIVDTDGSLDLDKLAKDIAKDLPKYARPVFIRIMKTMDMTATFKLRKVDLQKEGYDPNKVTDKLFYFDPKLNKYVSLGPEEFDQIVSGKIRL